MFRSTVSFFIWIITLVTFCYAPNSSAAIQFWCEDRSRITEDDFCIVTTRGGSCASGTHYDTYARCKVACKRIYQEECIEPGSIVNEQGAEYEN